MLLKETVENFSGWHPERLRLLFIFLFLQLAKQILNQTLKAFFSCCWLFFGSFFLIFCEAWKFPLLLKSFLKSCLKYTAQTTYHFYLDRFFSLKQKLHCYTADLRWGGIKIFCSYTRALLGHCEILLYCVLIFIEVTWGSVTERQMGKRRQSMW